MTKQESEAVTVVLNWIFLAPKVSYDREAFKKACLLLAANAHKHGSPWTRETVEGMRW